MTPQQIDAMKLALEALKKCHYYMIDAGLPNQSLLNEAFTAYKALEALKEHAMQEVQRLGQEIEQEPIGFVPRSVIDWLSSKHRSSSANITTTIWASPDKTSENAAIYISQPQPEQEPYSVQQAYAMAQVCLDLHESLGCKWGDNPYLTINQLKASPPQRKPLTHKEIWNAIRPLTQSDAVCMSLVQISMDEYRAIEAAHGIKENT
jgi:hypothetical protein